MHDNTILGGLLDLSDNNGALVAVCLVEFSQVLKRVFAGDVGVEDEERAVIFAQNLSSQLEGTSSTQGLLLDGEGDLYAILLLVLFPSYQSVNSSAEANGGAEER